MIARPALLLAVLVLAGCTDSEVESSPKIRAPAATVLGEAVTCISRTRIRDIDIHDDYTIDFEMSGGEVYRNTIAPRCPGLGFDERIAYSTSVEQLCSTDTFTVLHSDGSRGVTCGFGKFTPVKIDGE